MATFDNLYRKCYNKCNDDNKKAICHQTGKNAPVSRFCLQGYKITPNTEKRRTANLHKFWKYKNGLNCTPYKDSRKSHTYIYKKGILLKVCHAVTKWLQLSDVT